MKNCIYDFDINKEKDSTAGEEREVHHVDFVKMESNSIVRTMKYADF